MDIKFVAMPTEEARGFRAGGLDANGQQAERHISDGDGNPCRHCLQDIPKGAPMLILAYRPFSQAQPYAEAGPVFLCASECKRHPETATTPAMFLERQLFLLRGYDHRDRIAYGTGNIVGSDLIDSTAEELLKQPAIAYLHLRSGSYNCYQCKIERATSAAL